jgi:hypothetical protein
MDIDEHPLDHPFTESDEVSDEEFDESATRRWPIVVVSVLIAIVAIGAALYIAASHYQPLSQSPGGGYGSQILTSNGSLATNRITGPNGNIIWTEPSGVFHVEAIVTINNDQRFGVTIDKVLAPPNPSGTSDVRTYFDSKGSNIGYYSYKGGPAFEPTTLGSKGELQLVVHWNQQCVPASAASATTTYTNLPVEFTFMGFRHTVTVPIDTITITPRPTC